MIRYPLVKVAHPGKSDRMSELLKAWGWDNRGYIDKIE
jgi:hypothetical protein